MSHPILSRVDLHQLRTLIVLFEELNTTRAAERLHLTQPAVSRSLQKLRDVFDDELFVRSRYGLKPTEKAEQLARLLPPILDNLAQALTLKEDFDPANLDTEISFALHPALMGTSSHMLFMLLHQQAPKLRLKFTVWHAGTPEAISRDEINMGITLAPVQLPKSLVSRPLGKAQTMLFMRADHPLAKYQEVTPEAISTYPLAILHAPGWNEQISNAERFLNSLGLPCRVLLRAESPKAILEVIQESELIAPMIQASPEPPAKGIVCKPLAIDSSQARFDLLACFQARYRQNPLHNWLLECLKTATLPNEILK